MPEELVVSERYLEIVIIICTYGSAICNRNMIEPSSARCPGLLCSSSHCGALCFPQNFRWLKPCLTYTKVFPGVFLQAVINTAGDVPFWFRMKYWHWCQPSSHLVWVSWCILNSFRVRLSKSLTVYAAPVEWLLHSVLRAVDALPLEESTNTPCK